MVLVFPSRNGHSGQRLVHVHGNKGGSLKDAAFSSHTSGHKRRHGKVLSAVRVGRLLWPYTGDHPRERSDLPGPWARACRDHGWCYKGPSLSSSHLRQRPLNTPPRALNNFPFRGPFVQIATRNSVCGMIYGCVLMRVVQLPWSRTVFSRPVIISANLSCLLYLDSFWNPTVPFSGRALAKEM